MSKSNGWSSDTWHDWVKLVQEVEKEIRRRGQVGSREIQAEDDEATDETQCGIQRVPRNPGMGV